jgi:hypothetical protein
MVAVWTSWLNFTDRSGVSSTVSVSTSFGYGVLTSILFACAETQKNSGTIRDRERTAFMNFLR